MAEIELGALTDRLDEDELRSLAAMLDRVGVHYDLSVDKGAQTVAARLSEEAVTEFLDRLAAHDVAAEIYLPVEFEQTFIVGDYRIASTHSLSGALEELKEELDVDDGDDDSEEEEDDDSADDDHLITSQLKHIWRLMVDAAEESLDQNVPMHVRT